MARSTSAPSKGFTLIEIVLAVALTAIVVAGVANGMLITNRVLAQQGGSTTARLLADECVSVVRWIRDAEGFDALQEGTRGLDVSDGTWRTSTNPDFLGGFTRSVIISDGGLHGKHIECLVEWQDTGRTTSLSAVTVIAR